LGIRVEGVKNGRGVCTRGDQARPQLPKGGERYRDRVVNGGNGGGESSEKTTRLLEKQSKKKDGLFLILKKTKENPEAPVVPFSSGSLRGCWG
jgi:hypothetical protein